MRGPSGAICWLEDAERLGIGGHDAGRLPKVWDEVEAVLNCGLRQHAGTGGDVVATAPREGRPLQAR